MATNYLKNLFNKSNTQISNTTDLVTVLDKAYFDDRTGQNLHDITAALFQRGGYSADDFASLSAALTQAATDSKPTIVASSQSISSDTTVTAPIIHYEGGTIVIPTGVTLTINAPFFAGNKKVFSLTGTGKVVFGPNSLIGNINAVWFGADPTDTATSAVQTAAIQAALDSSYAVVGGGGRLYLVYIPKGFYTIGKLNLKGTTTIGRPGIVGDGMGNTILKLANSTDDVMFEIGGSGASESVNHMYMADLHLDGNAANQTGTSAILHLTRVDRSRFERLYLVDGKGPNLLVDESTVDFNNCEFFGAGTDNVIIDGVVSCNFHECFLNNATNYGVRAKYTKTFFAGSQSQTSAVFNKCHFEQNKSGEAFIDGFDNLFIVNGQRINPFTSANDVFTITGSARNNRIENNAIHWPTDIATYDGGGGSVSDKNYVKINAGSHSNIIGVPTHFAGGDDTATQFTPVDLELQVYDIDGRNRIYKEDGLIKANGMGGNWAAGHVTRNTTNLIAQADANDFTTANWVAANIASRSNVTTFGAPDDTAGGTATSVSFDASVSGTLTLTLSGLSIVSGDLVTFQLLARLASTWVVGQSTDIRLHILDSSNNILSDTSITKRIKSDWADAFLACQLSATTSYSTLKIQIYKSGFSTTNAAVFGRASCHVGDFGPVIPGGQTTYPGLAAVNATITNILYGNNNTLNLETRATAPTVQIGDTTNAGAILKLNNRLKITGSNNVIIEADVNNSGTLEFHTEVGGSTTKKVEIDNPGNLLVGGGTAGTSAVAALVIKNGTIPSSSPADSVQLYAEDVTSSSELKVRDEAGNVTTLSPHNFSKIPKGESEKMAWSFYSERDGQYVTADLTKALRVLEKLSGEKLIYKGKLKK